MTAFADDATATTSPRLTAGLGLAALSAMSFGMSGSLAKGLLEAGWTAGSAVTARVLIAAAVLLVPAIISLRGRWQAVRNNVGLILAYGTIAVAGCQLAYFNAVDHMQVGVALLIEFTSPVAVLCWMWFRHAQRPSRLTVAGAAVALAGLVLVLDLMSGADVSVIGVVWALGAMTGAAFYWIISADDDNGLPPLALAGGGLLCGGIVLLLAGLVGLVPFAVTRTDVAFVGAEVAWWVPIVSLGVVTAALAYVLGIAASRRLGSRLASFVGLSEAVAGVVFAWLLLDEAPAPVQLTGGVLILTGVVLVRLGEPRVRAAAVAVDHEARPST